MYKCCSWCLHWWALSGHCAGSAVQCRLSVSAQENCLLMLLSPPTVQIRKEMGRGRRCEAENIPIAIRCIFSAGQRDPAPVRSFIRFHRLPIRHLGNICSDDRVRPVPFAVRIWLDSIKICHKCIPSPPAEASPMVPEQQKCRGRERVRPSCCQWWLSPNVNVAFRLVCQSFILKCILKFY